MLLAAGVGAGFSAEVEIAATRAASSAVLGKAVVDFVVVAGAPINLCLGADNSPRGADDTTTATGFSSSGMIGLAGIGPVIGICDNEDQKDQGFCAAAAAGAAVGVGVTATVAVGAIGAARVIISAVVIGAAGGGAGGVVGVVVVLTSTLATESVSVTMVGLM